MEAIGAAASIASLLGLVGHSIDGLVKLRQFLDSTRHAKKKVKDLLQEISVLNSTLGQVQTMLRRIHDSPHEPARDLTAPLDELLNHIGLCKKDACEWATMAEGLDPGRWTGLKAFLRNIKVATRESLFGEFQNRISGHQRQISLSLSILGRQLAHLFLFPHFRSRSNAS